MDRRNRATGTETQGRADAAPALAAVDRMGTMSGYNARPAACPGRAAGTLSLKATARGGPGAVGFSTAPGGLTATTITREAAEARAAPC